MFIGHFAMGFFAKRAAPRLSLGGLFVGCQWLDLLWPMLVLAHIEQVSVEPGVTALTPLNFESYPWSHSLATSALWALAAAGLLHVLGRSTKESIVMAALVLSHWVLDFVSHAPDMPLWPGGTKVGLGLWNSVAASVAVECLLFGAGVVVYARSTRAVDRRGRWVLWSLVAFLALVYAGNVFGPQPQPGTPAAAIAGPALAMWLLVAWGAWADRHRVPEGA